MTARLVDVRLVLDRSAEIRVSIDGRPIEIPSTDDPSVALFELARRIDALAWSTKRPALELLADPQSAVFDRVTPRG